MDRLPTDIQFMIIKDLNPTSLLILIEQCPFIKDIIKEIMLNLIEHYINEYYYEHYLWQETETIDEFIENLKIRSSMQPINNDIIHEVKSVGWYDFNLIDDIRHFKMLSMLVKKLNYDDDINWFHHYYIEYKNPEKFAQEDADNRIHSMYEIIRMYPECGEMAEDTDTLLYAFNAIYNLYEDDRKIFFDTVDEYLARECPAFYIIDIYFLHKEAFDYYLNKGFSPKLSHTIAYDFNGRIDVSDERLFEAYSWKYNDDDLQEEIKEYIRQKSNNN